METKDFKKGDNVSWSAGTGTTSGVIEDVVTDHREVDGQMVQGSSGDPRYLVKNSNTGKITTHTKDALSYTVVEGGGKVTMNEGRAGTGENKQEFNKGDKVQWNSINGMVKGTVMEKITEDKEVNGQMARADEFNPQYVIKSEGGEVVHHKPSVLSMAS